MRVNPYYTFNRRIYLSDTEDGGETDVIGVPIGPERLFEVDVGKMMARFQYHIVSITQNDLSRALWLASISLNPYTGNILAPRSESCAQFGCTTRSVSLLKWPRLFNMSALD